MTAQPSIREEILAALCLIGDGEEGRKLFAFASPNDQEKLEKTVGQLEKDGHDLAMDGVIGQLQKVARLRSPSVLEEIHPGWILEKLEEESPRLLGLLCRLLSSDKTRYVIQHLNPEQKKCFPTINQSYQVDPVLSETVRQLVENKWQMELPARTGASFSFFHISWMKIDDLRSLFWDLGLEEVRKAFSGVDPKVLRTFLSRFSVSEAKEIRGRIDHGDSVSPEARREAQAHLVTLPLENLKENLNTEDLFREIGYSSFARALSSEDLSWGEWVAQKLAPEQGYRLKRILHEIISSGRDDVQKTRKAEITRRVFLLAKRGLIRRYWKEEKGD